MYNLEYTDKAKQDMQWLKRNEAKAYQKLEKLLLELMDHPSTGTGHPEPLTGRPNQWSRRITKKHRLVYEIQDEVITVLVLSACKHYNDK